MDISNAANLVQKLDERYGYEVKLITKPTAEVEGATYIGRAKKLPPQMTLGAILGDDWLQNVVSQDGCDCKTLYHTTLTVGSQLVPKSRNLNASFLENFRFFTRYRTLQLPERSARISFVFLEVLGTPGVDMDGSKPLSGL